MQNNIIVKSRYSGGNMVAVYVTSVEAAGKTALCAGIGRNFLSHGRKVGYVRPVQLSETSGPDGDRDAAFVKEAFELTESTGLLCPIRLSRRDLWQSLSGDVTAFAQRLRKAYGKISRGKDIVLMEGLSGLGADNVSTLACYTISETLDAKVIAMLRYSPTLEPSVLAQVGGKLEGRLLGVVVNFVPESKIEALTQDIAASFQRAGLRVLGVLPEVRSLLGVSVQETAQVLEGEILTCQDKTGEIVENVMLGAMTPDSGLDYFGRKRNKAAVIRGERIDMQLAALETSVRCLIITGDSEASPAVVRQAEDKGVPIMVVKQDTCGAIAGIEEALAKASFHNPQKLQTFDGILGRYFDFKALYSELGLEA